MSSRFTSLRVLVQVAVLAFATGAGATTVRMVTDRGPIDIELYDTQAPATVTNFLKYVRNGSYLHSFFHRLAYTPATATTPAKPFVLQGGGYRVEPVTKITTDPAIENEFSATRSNVRGTVAMAKLPGLPNSATSEWFVNLDNNSASLDSQNGGFTVFGRVTAPSMAVVDALAALTRVNAAGCQTNYSALTELPVYNASPLNCSLVRADNLVRVTAIHELSATASDADRIFNWLEAAYPQYAALTGASAGTFDGYTYRHYPTTNAYLGARDGSIYYLVPAVSGEIVRLGSVAELLASAAAAGY